MHPPFRDDFTIEVGQFLKKPYVLHEQRAAGTGSDDVLIVRYGCAVGPCQLLFIVAHY